MSDSEFKWKISKSYKFGRFKALMQKSVVIGGCHYPLADKPTSAWECIIAGVYSIRSPIARNKLHVWVDDVAWSA